VAPSDVAGVFSRYFIVGYFVPAFVTLALLKFGLSEELLPEAVEPDSAGTFLVIGTVALILALLLLGLNRPIQRLFEGYVFVLPYESQPYKSLRRLGSRLTERQRRRRQRLKDLLKTPHRRTAALLLERQFPHGPNDLLPTRLGNTLRAFERHGQRRWGIDLLIVWPHIQSLMSEQELQQLEDAEASYAMFLNGAALAIPAGLLLLGDAIFVTPHPTWFAWYLIPFLAAYPLYRGACTSAQTWGQGPRAAIDLHRLDLYKKMGLRPPATLEEEKRLNAALSDAVLWGVAKDLDPFRAPPDNDDKGTDQDLSSS
jgi:hypothetical protein